MSRFTWTPAVAGEFALKQQLDELQDAADSLDTAGTTVVGSHTHSTTDVTDLASVPLSELAAAVDDINLNSNAIVNLATPSDPTDAANKAYVDSVATGLSVKQAVIVATTANITLSGEQTIDDIAVEAGDRVLVKDQSTASQNGIYVVASGAWSRSTDADADAEVTNGMFTLVTSGTVNQARGYVLITPNPITLGTTGLTFTQFSGGGGSSLTIDDEGVALAGAANELDFVGTGVTVTGTGAKKTINVPGAASSGGITYQQPTDPGATGAGTTWLNTSTGEFFRRNTANTGWVPIAITPGVLNVGLFGTLAGNGSTDDTAAFQAAIAYAVANPGTSWDIYVPKVGSGDFKITSTLTWPSNVRRWIGSYAGRSTGSVRLSWFGSAGGTMISASVGGTQHGKEFLNIGMRSGVDGAKAATAIEFVDRVDSFCLIEGCSFSDFSGNPIKFSGGAINLHMKRFRTDGQGNHAVYFKVVGSCNISISQWTTDNDPSAGFTGGAGGSVHLDASAAADNSFVLCHLQDCNFEVQQNLASQSTNGVVKLSNKPDTSGRVLFYLSLDSVMMSGALAPVGNGNKSIRVTPATDNVVLTVRNSLLPGTIAGIPNLVQADTGLGSSGIVTTLVSYPFSNYIGDFPSGTKSPAMIVVGEANFLQGPLRSHGQVMCRQWGVLPATLPAGTNVYDGEEFVDAIALTTSSTSMVKVVCTDRGTTGTLSGVTGSGTSGASTVTVNDVTNLRKGQMITIAGTSATEYTIRDINATTLVLTLSTTLSATVSGAAVAFKAPTYRQYTQGSMTAYP